MFLLYFFCLRAGKKRITKKNWSVWKWDVNMKLVEENVNIWKRCSCDFIRLICFQRKMYSEHRETFVRLFFHEKKINNKKCLKGWYLTRHDVKNLFLATHVSFFFYLKFALNLILKRGFLWKQRYWNYGEIKKKKSLWQNKRVNW